MILNTIFGLFYCLKILEYIFKNNDNELVKY